MDGLTLRPAEKADAKQLFEWTNEAETRKNSFSSEPVLWENHIAWLDKKLADRNCLFFILLYEEKPAGTVRLDVNTETESGVISYSIAKDFRGNGFGGKLLALAEEEGKRFGLRYLLGSVKPDNKASSRCFLKNGYEPAEETKTELVYRKQIGPASSRT